MAKFRRESTIVDAIRVTNYEGIINGWLITSINGRQYLCEDWAFKNLYIPVDNENQQLLSYDADIMFPPDSC